MSLLTQGVPHSNAGSEYRGVRIDFMWKNKMTTKRKIILVTMLAAVAMQFSACGRRYQGTWKGNETVIRNGVSSSHAVTITLNDSNGDYVSGTWTSPDGVGQLRAKPTGAGLEQVQLVMTPAIDASAAQQQSTSSVNSYTSNLGYTQAYGAFICGGTFSGTLTYTNNNNNGLSGVLTLSNPGTGCSGAARTIDVSK